VASSWFVFFGNQKWLTTLTHPAVSTAQNNKPRT